MAVTLPDPADARRRIAELVAERGESLSALSRAANRNLAYFHQYLYRKSPDRLPEDVRLMLAVRWQVDERELGAREPWRPTPAGSR